MTLSLDYDAIRKAVLNGYKKVPEAYRQQFCRCQEHASQTYVEFFWQKQLLCQHLVESSLATCDFDALLELVVMEEIKSCVPPKVRAHMEERDLCTLAEAGPAADHFSLTNHDSVRRNQIIGSILRGDSTRTVKDFGSGGFHKSVPTSGCAGIERRTVTCSYCKQPAHHISSCRRRPIRNNYSQDRTFP